MVGRQTARGGVMLTISTASLEYVLIPVAARASGASVDPTGDTVQMAILSTEDAPVSGDFKTASWETDATTTPDTYYARCLVGTGGAIVLAAGLYQVWVKITDSPEAPVKPAGRMRVV
jgi:hypothetical protein